jgi:hypothetical protein
MVASTTSDLPEVETVWLWNRATGRRVGTISDQSGFAPNTLRFSP